MTDETPQVENAEYGKHPLSFIFLKRQKTLLIFEKLQRLKRNERRTTRLGGT